MTADNNTSIKSIHQTKKKYYVNNQNNFCILPDQKSVVGYDYISGKLQIEDITSNAAQVVIDEFSIFNIVSTIVYNRKFNVLFVGNENGRLIKYKQGKNNKWKQDHDYGKLNIGRFTCCDQFQHYAFFAGTNKNNITMININNNKMINQNIDTPFDEITSLSIGVNSKIQILLNVCGDKSDFKYTKSKTDIFKLNNLFDDNLRMIKNNIIISEQDKQIQMLMDKNPKLNKYYQDKLQIADDTIQQLTTENMHLKKLYYNNKFKKKVLSNCISKTKRQYEQPEYPDFTTSLEIAEKINDMNNRSNDSDENDELNEIINQLRTDNMMLNERIESNLREFELKEQVMIKDIENLKLRLGFSESKQQDSMKMNKNKHKSKMTLSCAKW